MKKIKKIWLTFLVLVIIIMCTACSESISSNNTLDSSTETLNDTFDSTEKVVSSDVFAETAVDQSEWPMPEQSSYLDAFPKFELKMTPDPSFYNVDWSDDVRNTYIKLPVSYEENVDGVLIKVEFFQEKYVMYSFIQARVTYTNTNDYPIYTVIGHDVYFAGAFVKNNSEIKSFQYAEPEEFSGFAVDRQYPLTLNQGQSFVGELIYFADNSFFKPDAEYEYILSFADKNSLGNNPQAYTVTIPVEVCAP